MTEVRGTVPRVREVLANFPTDRVTSFHSPSSPTVQIGISEPPVRPHLASFCGKLRVPNQFKLILFALYHQLIDTYELSPPCH